MQEKLIDQQMQEFTAFESEQAAINAQQVQTPLQQALAGVKNMFKLPANLLTNIKIGMENLKYSAPYRLFENLPPQMQEKKKSNFIQAMTEKNNQRIGAAMDELSSIPEGKTLVDMAKKDGLPIIGVPGVRNGSEGALAWLKERDANGAVKTSYRLTVNTLHSHGQIVGLLAHELEHYNQAKNNVIEAPASKIEAPLDSVWRTRMIEADAQATAVDISYKLKQAGKPDAWNEQVARKNAFSPMAKAYGAMAKQDPLSIEDGRAKRAAFDKWHTFKTPVTNVDISRVYNRQGITNYPDREAIVMKAEKDGALVSPLTPQELKKLGSLLPAQTNYLDLQGQKPLDSKFYRERNFSQPEMFMLKERYDAFGSLKGITPKTPTIPTLQSGKFSTAMSATPKPLPKIATPQPKAPRM